ncbi:MAG: peroxidase family protein, partial [Candidatus Poseidoniia archaeon]
MPDTDDTLNPRIDMLSGQSTRGVRANSPAGYYDDELLGVHFICGDGRCNENIALTTIHTIFHREHNRLVYVTKRQALDAVAARGEVRGLAFLNQWLAAPLTIEEFNGLGWVSPDFLVTDASLANQTTTEEAIHKLGLHWNGERVFQAARFVTEMEYNRIVFDEFGPTLAGLKDPFEGYHTNVDPSITAEFSQSVYRFGHSMLVETLPRFDVDFNVIPDAGAVDPATADGQLGLFEAFLNPLAFYNSTADGTPTLTPEQASGAVVRGLTRTHGNELDEFITGALSNNLVGLPLDLGAINIARGRDVGNPPLNEARKTFHAATGDTRLAPYGSWADYLDNMRHEGSFVNFLASYGTHPLLAGPDGIIGNADDVNRTYEARRDAACAIVGALSSTFCTDTGFLSTIATPDDAINFLFSLNEWANIPDADASKIGDSRTGVDDIDFWNGGLAEA